MAKPGFMPVRCRRQPSLQHRHAPRRPGNPPGSPGNSSRCNTFQRCQSSPVTRPTLPGTTPTTLPPALLPVGLTVSTLLPESRRWLDPFPIPSFAKQFLISQVLFLPSFFNRQITILVVAHLCCNPTGIGSESRRKTCLINADSQTCSEVPWVLSSPPVPGALISQQCRPGHDSGLTDAL